MSHRPLALVSGLTVGDYLLWNWSLTNGHDVLALTAGLTLLPLGAAWVWLLTLSLAHLLARSARRGSSISARRRGAGARRDPQRRHAAGTASRAVEEPAAASTAASSASPSRKLAA
ncbi:MAG: hypothetical protein ACHQAV_02940 [Solirubrobacterales bacterium]